jgi:hypothetical protein
MSKYKMIQIAEDSYNELKQYCEEHDKKLGKTVEKLIHVLVSPPLNTLKSEPKK